jgi:hypothetical protein
MMFIDLLDGDVQQETGYFCFMTGSKYLEYNPGSELNIYWWIWKLYNEIESNKVIEQKSNKDQ